MVALVPSITVRGQKKDDFSLVIDGETCKFFRIIHDENFAGYRWEIRSKNGREVLAEGGHAKCYKKCVMEGFTELFYGGSRVSLIEKVNRKLASAAHHREQLEAIANELVEMHGYEFGTPEADLLFGVARDGHPYEEKQIMEWKKQEL